MRPKKERKNKKPASRWAKFLDIAKRNLPWAVPLVKLSLIIYEKLFG